ncbi:MAG: helix-turn-helix transcriptional regulator [Pseudomonadota bacterium]
MTWHVGTVVVVMQWHMTRYTHHHLRGYRRRSGLTQRDLGLLLGFINGAEVGRYERSVRLPTVQTLFACQAIFDVDARMLFPDTYQEIEALTHKRARELRETLVMDQRTLHRRQILKTIIERGPQRTIDL